MRPLASLTPVRYALVLAGGLLLLLVPLIVTNAYILIVLNLILLYIILAVGLNLPVGLTGQISLCHAAFWGLGAYFSAILTQQFGLSFWLILPMAGLFAGLFGLLVGFSTIRVAGDYLALVTLGFGEVTRVVFLNWTEVTRGPMGIPGIPDPNPIGPIHFDSYTSFYYLLLLAVGLILWTTRRIIRSRVGLAFRSVSNEIAAQSLGVNTLHYKILAFTLGAVYAGWAGSLYVHLVGFVSPETFTFLASVTVLSMVIIGGKGSLIGAIIGAVVLTIISEALRDLQVWRMILYAIVLTISMVFMPGGIVGVYRQQAAKRRPSPAVEVLQASGAFAGAVSTSPVHSLAVESQAVDLPLREQASQQSSPLLEIHDLTVMFGGLAAVNKVSLAIQPGTIHSIIGPNGAGKTTLFNAITGNHAPDGGTIHLNGMPIHGRKPYEIARRGIARTFQTTRLFPEMTVIENMLVARHVHTHTGLLGAVARPPGVRKEEAASYERVREILAFLDLEGHDDELPNHLDYASQRRLEIALALTTSPLLLLLDEPAAGLNPQETIESTQLIGRIREQGTTVLLIEHEMQVVMGISDNVTVLNYGKKIAEGTPTEVQDNPVVIEAYLGRQKSNA